MHVDTYNQLLSVDLNEVQAMAAPDMGDYESGKACFEGVYPGPAYVRSGGTPVTQLLVAHSLKHLIKAEPNEDGHLPHTIVTNNGQAANNAILGTLMRGGNNIVASPYIFGSTSTLLGDLGDDYDAEVKSADPTNPQSFVDRTTADTRAWFVEDISNPIGIVADLEGLREAANECGVLLVVDNTLSAGQPKANSMDYADIVTMSLTKQAGGGNNINVGGLISFNNHTDWHAQNHHFPKIDKYFNDVSALQNPLGSLVSKFGQFKGFSSIAPRDALDIARCLPAVEDNLQTMSQNAKILADFLSDHPAIKNIQLTGYGNTPNDERMHRYFGDHHYVIFAEMTGGNEAARRFIDLDDTFHAVALGQAPTAWTSPIITTHRQLAGDTKKQKEVGINDGHVRGSIGTENPEELVEHMSQLLELAR